MYQHQIVIIKIEKKNALDRTRTCASEDSRFRIYPGGHCSTSACVVFLRRLKFENSQRISIKFMLQKWRIFIYYKLEALKFTCHNKGVLISQNSLHSIDPPFLSYTIITFILYNISTRAHNNFHFFELTFTKKNPYVFSLLRRRRRVVSFSLYSNSKPLRKIH